MDFGATGRGNGAKMSPSDAQEKWSDKMRLSQEAPSWSPVDMAVCQNQ